MISFCYCTNSQWWPCQAEPLSMLVSSSPIKHTCPTSQRYKSWGRPAVRPAGDLLGSGELSPPKWSTEKAPNYRVWTKLKWTTTQITNAVKHLKRHKHTTGWDVNKMNKRGRERDQHTWEFQHAFKSKGRNGNRDNQIGKKKRETIIKRKMKGRRRPKK